MAQVNLPPGFELDQNLPPGFVLDGNDKPPSKPLPEPSNLQRLTTAMASGYQRHGLPGAFFGGAATGGKILDEGLHNAAYNVGGYATDVASNAGASPEVAGGIGAVTKTGIESIPDILGGKAIGVLAKPAFVGAAKTLMQSAVKPNQAVRLSGDATKAIDTMLEKRINATAGGVEDTQTKVGNMESAMQKILDLSPATVDKTKVASGVQSALDKVKLDPARADSEAQIMKAATDFWDHPALRDLGNDIPVGLANKMKQAFYKELSDRAYVPGAQISAYDKGEKAIAGSLRTEVLKAEPQIAPTLAEQAELMNVLKVLKPRVAVEGNKNIIGMGVLSPNLERVAAWMLDRWPWFKSYLAHTAYSGAERIPQTVGTAGLMVTDKIKEKDDGR